MDAAPSSPARNLLDLIWTEIPEILTVIFRCCTEDDSLNWQGYTKPDGVCGNDNCRLFGLEHPANWTKAILMVNAEVVHICMAPEAEDIIVKLLSDIAAPFEIIRHERLTPLSYSGSISSLKQIRDGPQHRLELFTCQ